MKFSSIGAVAGLAMIAGMAQANLLGNGNLDKTYQQEIVPGFFLPKPTIWENIGSRSTTGPYEDEMSSEPWSGPAPTPVTNDGANGDDWGVFFKPFSGSANDMATGHLQQTVAALPGLQYTLTGWAGAEANFLARDAVFALDFFNAAGAPLASAELSLMGGLFVDNGEPFDYKKYTVSALSPAGTAAVRARVSMIDAMANPQGGGQAFVVDDFELNAVPEPGTYAALGLGALVLVRRRRK